MHFNSDGSTGFLGNRFILTCDLAATNDQTGKISHPPSERLASLDKMGAQLRSPLKPLNTIMLWYTGGFMGGHQFSPMMPSKSSLSDNCTFDRCSFWVWRDGAASVLDQSWPAVTRARSCLLSCVTHVVCHGVQCNGVLCLLLCVTRVVPNFFLWEIISSTAIWARIEKTIQVNLLENHIISIKRIIFMMFLSISAFLKLF